MIVKRKNFTLLANGGGIPISNIMNKYKKAPILEKAKNKFRISNYYKDQIGKINRGLESESNLKKVGRILNKSRMEKPALTIDMIDRNITPPKIKNARQAYNAGTHPFNFDKN